jgi:hypothetical protein
LRGEGRDEGLFSGPRCTLEARKRRFNRNPDCSIVTLGVFQE